MRLELAWGGFRRWYLKTFRSGYVARMRAVRRGEPAGCPHEVLDPRDLKFYRNQTTCHWDPAHDPFRWRDRLPFVRVGLCELFLIAGGFFVLTGVLAWFYPYAAIVPFVLGLCVVWFFRNPRRVAPVGPGVVVSPADGKIVHIEELAHDPDVGGPALLIGIFLSVFNVHANRAPVASRVLGLKYRRGKFLNALLAASVRENEQLAVRIQETSAPGSQTPGRQMVVRQIAGAIARRIVCWIKPGDELGIGEQFGMIKLGSRTELVMPLEPGLEIVVKLGQNVKAGTSVLARYAASHADRAAGAGVGAGTPGEETS